MRLSRSLPAFLAVTMLLAPIAPVTPLVLAQSVDEAEEDAAAARERAEIASGLVDEAIENRTEIELELAASIARLNELSARLSVIGAGLDRIASQIGFADVELAGIRSDIESQAVDAYMTVLSSPTISLVGSGSVEQALVAGSVVEDVVAAGRATVDELMVKRRTLEELQMEFLTKEREFEAAQAEVDAEAENLASLFEQADAAVADAVRQARLADADYRAALSAVDEARVREEERQRQEARPAPPTTDPPAATNPAPTTTTTVPDTSEQDTGTRTWDHPPAVEQWRSLVEEFFPSHRVEEALAILNCESNGDPDAYNPYSGASGLFQFIPSTWASTAPQAGYPNASAFEPVANTASAAWLANRYEQLGLYYWQAWSCKRVLD